MGCLGRLMTRCYDFKMQRSSASTDLNCGHAVKFSDWVMVREDWRHHSVYVSPAPHSPIGLSQTMPVNLDFEQIYDLILSVVI